MSTDTPDAASPEAVSAPAARPPPPADPPAPPVGLGAVAADVAQLRDDVEAIRRFAKRSRDDSDQLVGQLQKQLAQTLGHVLGELIFPLHDQLFRRLVAMESGQDQPDAFTMGLLENLEGNLERCDVMVIRPHAGEPLQVSHMEAAGNEPARFWRKPDTVARVHTCGFAVRHPDGNVDVLRKARVDVIRKT